MEGRRRCGFHVVIASLSRDKLRLFQRVERLLILGWVGARSIGFVSPVSI